jgi:hypothetical protein
MSTVAYGSSIPAAQPRLRLTARGRAVLAVLIAAPLIAAVWAGFGDVGAQATGTPGTGTFEYVSVQPGQSLWQLAEQVAPQADPREVVADILRLNNLASADVQPGQELAIPAEYAG